MMKQQQNGTKPSAVFTRIVKNVKRQFHYLKTLHSLQELDDFRFEQECDFPNKQNFANVRQIPCIKAKPALTGCQFALLAWRPKRNQKQIHVYGYGSHNHDIAPIDKRAMHQKICWSDEQKVPAIFNTPNGCKWTYVETRTTKKSAKKFVNLLLELKRKYHCHQYRKALEVERSYTAIRCLTLYCTNRSAGTSFMCDFKMLIQRTDQDRFHLYTSGQHRCMNKDDNVLSQYMVLPDAHPPANIVTKGGQNWTFVETMETEKDDKDLIVFAHTIGRKYKCYKQAIKQLQKHRLICRMQLYCTTRDPKCRFRLLAQKTDRNRFHLYVSGKHTCFHGNKDERPRDKIVILRSNRSRQWNFMETAEAEENLTKQLAKWNKRFHCCSSRGQEEQKKQPFVCRITLVCTAKSSGCPFAVLVQKTDRGRFHLYWSGRKHTCLHAGKGLGGGRWQETGEKETDEEEEINEEEKDDDEDDIKDLDEEENHFNDDEMEKEKHDEEEGEEERCCEEENGDDDEEMEERMWSEEEEVDDVNEEKVNGDVEKKDPEAISVANVVQMRRSPTVPQEINDVQFVDFVDHPKSEGVKMRRLDEPKKEQEVDGPMIKLIEETANRWQKVLKQEIVKEEAPEYEPGPSNRGQLGQDAPPMAVINRQNHQPVVMARNRWWADNEPAANHRTEASNEQRLLRERKHRINYRE